MPAPQSGLWACLVLFFALGQALTLQAQSIISTDSAQSIDGLGSSKRLHRWKGARFYQTENSFGLVPAINVSGADFVGLGLARGYFEAGEGGGMSRGMSLSLDYSPGEEIWAPRLSAWLHGNAFIFGGNVGLSGIYYMRGEETSFALRPELGIGYLKVFINYGYQLFLDPDFPGLSPHSWFISYYHSIYPSNKR